MRHSCLRTNLLNHWFIKLLGTVYTVLNFYVNLSLSKSLPPFRQNFVLPPSPRRGKAKLGSTLEGCGCPVDTSAKQKHCLSRQASYGAVAKRLRGVIYNRNAVPILFFIHYSLFFNIPTNSNLSNCLYLHSCYYVIFMLYFLQIFKWRSTLCYISILKILVHLVMV